MRRSRLALLFTLGAVALLAACGGSSSGGDAATPAPTAAPTRAAGSNLTPVSAHLTPTATAAPQANTTTATAPAAPSPTTAVTATVPPPASATTPAQPATAPPPTPTPVPQQSNNPMSATIGVTGTSRFFWAPNAVKVAPGATVTWTWNEPVQLHNVAGNFGLTTDFKKAETVSFTFNSPGSYSFYCDTHPDTMRGAITVE